MTITTNTYTPEVADGHAKATLDDRLAHAPEIGTTVRVLGAVHGHVVGRIGLLQTIDPTDAHLTFYVEWADGVGWAYEIEPVTDDNTPTPQAASAELNDLRARIAELQGQISLAEARLVAFKAEVRDMAIKVAEERGWCDEGLNDVLSELGLEPKTTKWTVTVRVFAYQDVELEIEAETEDDASEEALSEAETEVNVHDWEIDSGQDPEIQSVEQS